MFESKSEFQRKFLISAGGWCLQVITVINRCVILNLTMAGDSRTKSHLKRCAYPQCGAGTRTNVVPGVTFHVLPTNNEGRLHAWIKNCGLHHFRDLPNDLLKKQYICSQHFSAQSFHPSGKLKRDAVPKQLVEADPENVAGEHENAMNVDFDESNHLRQRVAVLERQLAKEQKTSAKLRYHLHSKRNIICRLKRKLADGDISDDTLKKAIEKRVQGYLLVFIMMQLFRKESEPFSKPEKMLCMFMNYTSTSLYSKLRNRFAFKLPHQTTLSNWFATCDIWPGICQVFLQT